MRGTHPGITSRPKRGVSIGVSAYRYHGVRLPDELPELEAESYDAPWPRPRFLRMASRSGDELSCLNGTKMGCVCRGPVGFGCGGRRGWGAACAGVGALCGALDGCAWYWAGLAGRLTRPELFVNGWVAKGSNAERWLDDIVVVVWVGVGGWWWWCWWVWKWMGRSGLEWGFMRRGAGDGLGVKTAVDRDLTRARVLY